MPAAQMTAYALQESRCGDVGVGEIIRGVPLTPEEIGQRIARARDEHDPRWAQPDLAMVMNVAPTTIYRWEKGRLPSYNVLLELAEKLGKPADYLTEPRERQLELADLQAAIQEIRQSLEASEDQVERRTNAVAAGLASIDARLSHIEELLALQVQQAK